MRKIEDWLNVRVRFSESDAMGVVWHGNYLKYFEDGREKLGKTFNMSYMDIYGAGYVVPIVKVEVDYKSPIQYGQDIRVICRLLDSKAAKIIHEYEIWNESENKLSCKGKTVQVFINNETKELDLTYPSFYANWKSKIEWQES